MKVACTVLYLIPWGFILLRALRELPTWMVFITLDDEVSNLLPWSVRERGPRSFPPLSCSLHSIRWWDTRRSSSLFQCIDIPSYGRTAWLSPCGAEFWDGCVATMFTYNLLCVWNPWHQQNGRRVCLAFHHTIRLLMNKKHLCMLQFNTFCAQAAAAGIWTAFLSAQTQISNSVCLLQVIVALIFEGLYLQRSPSILCVAMKSHHARVM